MSDTKWSSAMPHGRYFIDRPSADRLCVVSMRDESLRKLFKFNDSSSQNRLCSAEQTRNTK